MFGKYMKNYCLLIPEADDSSGMTELREVGSVKAALSHRSSEEVAEHDVSRSSETLIGITKQRGAMSSLICRGAVLRDGEGILYTVKYTVNAGDNIVMFLSASIFDGSYSVNRTSESEG